MSKRKPLFRILTDDGESKNNVRFLLQSQEHNTGQRSSTRFYCNANAKKKINKYIKKRLGKFNPDKGLIINYCCYNKRWIRYASAFLSNTVTREMMFAQLPGRSLKITYRVETMRYANKLRGLRNSEKKLYSFSTYTWLERERTAQNKTKKNE